MVTISGLVIAVLNSPFVIKLLAIAVWPGRMDVFCHILRLLLAWQVVVPVMHQVTRRLHVHEAQRLLQVVEAPVTHGMPVWREQVKLWVEFLRGGRRVAVVVVHVGHICIQVLLLVSVRRVAAAILLAKL